MKPLHIDAGIPGAASASRRLEGPISVADNTRYLPAIGRILIGGIFAMSGLTKVSAYAATTAAITAAGLPFAPLGWAVALAVEIGLGLLLLLGWRVRPVAAALALWCLVTAVFFHRDFADQNMMIHFLKNLMIAGGLLQVVHFGAGAFSLDARRNAGGRS
jgi:putative oxidoreductase